MISTLEQEPRLVVDATLNPVVGSIFQPTGFPDLGAATFERPGGLPAMLVESVQSLTNHFEALGWDGPAQRPVEALAALPYVEVRSGVDGSFLTSSRLEPHRLASAYVRDAAVDGATGLEWIAQRLELADGRPLDWPVIYRAIFELDPLCLVHGVFFSHKGWHGNPKVRRALTAVIEAHDVRPVVSGGLKRDDVSFRQGGEGRGAEEGYGFVPFGRTEYTAAEIVLTASIDLAQIRGYGLSPEATRLLTAVALWELAQLLAQPLRLRTACDLEVAEVRVRRPDDVVLPSADDLRAEIEGAGVELEEPGARSVLWPAPNAKKSAKADEQ
jgi:CRISPR-associated protein Csb1